jgi:hypothetical protein
MKEYVMYKITCEDVPDYLYIGCTVNFRQRKCTHKRTCNQENVIGHNRKLYKTIRDNGGWENWNMSPIETYECETKLQAHMRETELMSIHTSNLNSVVSFRSDEGKKERNKAYKCQYRKDNIESMKEYACQYRENNGESIIMKQREYRLTNKQSVADYQRAYRERNKDKLIEYHKKYYEKYC